jgi:Protein of unknown function (DUF2924)
MADVNTRAIERKLDRIRSLGLEELRLEWRRLYHSDAPRISRDLLILGLGYRLQEIEQGGLGKATRRKLQTIAKALRTTGRVGATPNRQTLESSSFFWMPSRSIDREKCNHYRRISGLYAVRS